MAPHPSLHSARLLLVAATIVAWPGSALGATFFVNSTLDAVDVAPGNGICATAGGVCTLRAAIQETRGLGGAHVITLPAGIYVFTIAGRGELAAATGDLNLIADLTINGAGAPTTIIDANGLDRVFANSQSALTLNDLTVQNGNPGNTAGGCIFASEGNLTLTRVIVKSCRADGGGGGIYVLGRSFVLPQTTVTVTDTTISQNVATGTGGGGGLQLWNGITATMIRATISGNSAAFAAGIRVVTPAGVPSILTMTDSVITQNVVTSTPAGPGGGLLLEGATGTLNRVTVSNNSGCCGAGVDFFSSQGSLTVVDSTITQNASPTTGGGVAVQNGGSAIPATITRTTIAGNSAGQGGGLVFGGKVTLSNSTVAGNTATSSGGAIFYGASGAADVSLINVTIASNSSSTVGAVHAVGQISVKNTIIANSTGAAPANCSTASLMNDLGNNLEFPGTSCGFDLASDVQADPLLGTLADNGGPTMTMSLASGSPAMNAGDDAACAAAPVSNQDQRGASRSVGAGAHCDMGADERAPLPFTDDPIVAGVTTIRALQVLELRSHINVIRAALGLPAYTWTDPTLAPGSAIIKTQHIIDLRSALAEAYVAATLTPPTYTDAVLTTGVTVARAVHIAELRAAVTAIE